MIDTDDLMTLFCLSVFVGHLLMFIYLIFFEGYFGGDDD